MTIKGLNEIVYNMINNIHDALREADTKEGTFIRDVFVNPASNQIAGLYDDIRLNRMSQSLLTATDNELDRLASNYFIDRKLATRSYGTVRFKIKHPVLKEVVIPKGTRVSTIGTTTSPGKVFETTETRIVPIGYSMIDPGNPTLVYVDILAASTFANQDANVGAMAISKLQTVVDTNIVTVENPLQFTGGTDKESDSSLAIRISLALSGANIGTKDGYASFILKQGEVLDARVVAAGEPLMKRDQGKGGKVDIYVRAQKLQEEIKEFNVDMLYVTDLANKPAYSDIVLPKQPVVTVVSLKGTLSGSSEKTYLDGSNFYSENTTNKYYLDTLWTFRDPIYIGTPTPKQSADMILNTRLQLYMKNLNYLTNTYYNLNWSKVVPNNDILLPADPNFLRGFHPDELNDTGINKIYMIKSKVDITNSYVGGRYFVLNDGQIYERKYYQPDFILQKDSTDYSNSNVAKDAIRWLDTGINKPVENEVLNIKYAYNSVILDLQTRINEKRVLTADVLVMQSKRLGIEIYAKVLRYNQYTNDEVKAAVINAITNYINNIQKMGGSISISDLAFIIAGTTGVDEVNLEKLKLARTNGPNVKLIQANENQYLEVDRVSIDVIAPGPGVTI